jgi:hypothetical protein
MTSHSAPQIKADAVTHGLLDDLPQTQALHYVREMLVSSGVLPARNEHLAIDGHRLMLPTRLAHLVRQLRDQDEPRWTLGRMGTPASWLFPGQSPARPAVDILLGVRLHRYGIDAHAGRNTARHALAAELPASVLADLIGISISTAERWSQWAKRDWAAYVGQRAADNAEGVDSRKPAKQTLQTC